MAATHGLHNALVKEAQLLADGYVEQGLGQVMFSGVSAVLLVQVPDSPSSGWLIVLSDVASLEFREELDREPRRSASDRAWRFEFATIDLIAKTAVAVDFGADGIGRHIAIADLITKLPLELQVALLPRHLRDLEELRVSTLERLFTYAKASEVSARENFTTEALAGAIRIEPEPFVDFLRTGLLLPPGPIRDIDISTQVAVPGTGYLDVVLSCVSERGREELWGELKVDAGESGTQLDAYLRHIEGLPAARRPRLFTLGRSPVRDDPAIPFLSWHALRRSLLAQPAGPAWLDFAQYLSEISVSDDFDQAISAHEAASCPTSCGCTARSGGSCRACRP